MSDRYERALALRRKVLGAEYVDRSLGEAGPERSAFQAFLTEFAWGTWDDDALTLQEHALIVIAMAAAMGRGAELALHLRAARDNGIPLPALLALTRKVTAYAGAPASLAVWRELVDLFPAELA